LSPALARPRWHVRVGHGVSLPTLLVWLFMLAYTLFFSAYALQRHATLNSHAADLSFIDQPMWNSLHGRFLERTMDARQVSRVAEHLEPIILPIALIYLVWDDVRAILIIQSLALALGALPVYWIARQVLSNLWPAGRRAAWLALPFVLAFLMFPALQAANLADFHADPFVVAPLLFAFWYASQQRYRAMWAWALVAVLVKETLPLLIFMLGLYLVLFPARGAPAEGTQAIWPARRRRHGLALMGVSLAWFYVATFLIVAPLARQVYGTPGPVYFAYRYAPQEQGIGGWLGGLLQLALEPERLLYLGGLLASVGGLALLAPECLLLGLPVLVANYFSNFAGQYSGEQHYSAPLAPVFVLAAIYGVHRLVAWSWKRPGLTRLKRALPIAAITWLLIWSMGYHWLRGWTPLARDFKWPAYTAHHALLARFTAQIPSQAALSTTPPLHPHLAHRAKIYLFPEVADADYVLLDVTGRTDAHPNDVRAGVDRLLRSEGFGLVDAADGYLLLARNAGAPVDPNDLPDAFYDFARAPGAQPEHLSEVIFGDAHGAPLLRLVGYDVVDDPTWQQTRLRYYWQTLAPLPADVWPWPFVFDDDGQLIEDTAQRPMVALIWYPPSRWRPGETVMTETLPWQLGPRFNVGVALLRSQPAGAALAFLDPGHHLPVQQASPASPAQGSWAWLGRFERVGRYLTAATEPPQLNASDTRFGNGIRLTAYRYRSSTNDLSVVLRWQAQQPVARSYTVFVHLVAPDGRLVAQSDAIPTWVTPWPTDRWRPEQAVLDGHRIALPADLAAGDYELRVGLYDWQTLERLPVLDERDLPQGDYALLGKLHLSERR